MSERDLVQRLKDYAGGDWSNELGQIPVALVQAAEVIEQYRADTASDLQTNNELRAQRDALRAELAIAKTALEKIAAGVVGSPPQREGQ